MKTTSQRGVALVVSLIMLGLVTMLAIAFIGITRRERHSVEATKKTTEAKLMADASLARAQTEVMERLTTTSISSCSSRSTASRPIRVHPSFTTSTANRMTVSSSI